MPNIGVCRPISAAILLYEGAAAAAVCAARTSCFAAAAVADPPRSAFAPAFACMIKMKTDVEQGKEGCSWKGRMGVGEKEKDSSTFLAKERTAFTAFCTGKIKKEKKNRRKWLDSYKWRALATQLHGEDSTILLFLKTNSFFPSRYYIYFSHVGRESECIGGYNRFAWGQSVNAV